MHKIAVECRTSTIVSRSYSLSALLRLIRPLRKAADGGAIQLIERSTEQLLADDGDDYDILFVSKPKSHANRDVVEKAKSRGAKVIVDVDDWMYRTPRYGENLMTSPDPSHLHKVLALADAMTVSTTLLGQVMGPLFDRPISVLPYGFDFSALEPASAPAGASPRRIIISTMFTIALSSRLPDFSQAVRSFLDRNPDWQIDFFAENPPKDALGHERINVIAPVPFEQYLQILGSGRYAFAIAPLAGYEDEDDILFNACKSPLKYIDYSANRIPGVYSRSPVFEAAIVNESTGLLVDNTTKDWLDAMSRMAGDPTLRNGIAARSHADVHDRFNFDLSVAAIKDVIECAVS